MMSEKLTEKVVNLTFISFYYNSMATNKLDDLQRRLIAFFKQNTNQEGLTLREIANEVWATHPQTVLNKLNQLVLKGYFIKDDRWYRLIREEVWKRNDDIIQLPIYGFAQCGNKGKEIIDEYSQEKIPVTIAFIGTSDIENCFFVVHNQRPKLKKIIKQDNKLILESINRFFDKVEISPYDETKVIGVVKKIIKNM